MKPSELLRAAKARIAEPEHWCRGHFDLDGDRMCSVGAIGKVLGRQPLASADFGFGPAITFLDKAAGGNIVKFQDAHTHAEVMAAFERAIALAEAAETTR